MKILSRFSTKSLTLLVSVVLLCARAQDYNEVQIEVEQDPRVSNGTSNEFEYPCNPADAARYTSYRVRNSVINVDGKLDEEVWKIAPRSPQYVDIITGLPTRYETTAAVLWDEENLYIGIWLQEPDVEANFTERNSPLWQENDIEVFIAGRDAYYEFQVNALNTIYEAFFVWDAAYELDGYSEVPELQQSNPLVKPWNGVNFTTHPRGPRHGSWDFHLENLQSGVNVDGTLNNDADIDNGWTVELAFPWASMELIARGDGRPTPPEDGDVWRMDFSRFNTKQAPSPPEDSTGWVWSPHYIWDSHIPECFPYITFTTECLKEAEALGQIEV